MRTRCGGPVEEDWFGRVSYRTSKRSVAKQRGLLTHLISRDDIVKWDMAETAKGGPFKEIVESDIFVNCIYLNSKIPHFVNKDSLQSPDRRLSVVCDVSADTTNPNNPSESSPPWTVAPNSSNTPYFVATLISSAASSHLHRRDDIQGTHRPRRGSTRPAAERHQYRSSPQPAAAGVFGGVQQ